MIISDCSTANLLPWHTLCGLHNLHMEGGGGSVFAGSYISCMPKGASEGKARECWSESSETDMAQISPAGETDKHGEEISCSEVEQEGGKEIGEGDRTESKSNLCR